MFVSAHPSSPIHAERYNKTLANDVLATHARNRKRLEIGESQSTCCGLFELVSRTILMLSFAFPVAT